MFQEFLSRSEHLDLPLAAFLLFFTTFLAVVVYLVRGILRRDSFDRVARLPLEDDSPADREGGPPR